MLRVRTRGGTKGEKKKKLQKDPLQGQRGFGE